jgi:hypothetical protein
MSTPLRESAAPNNIPDFWSQTESEDDDPAVSLYAPKCARLIPGGPPLELGDTMESDASVGNIPQFLVAPDRADQSYIERLEAGLRRLAQRSTDFSWPSPEPPPEGRADSVGYVAGAGPSLDQVRPMPVVPMRGRRSKHRDPLAALPDVFLFLIAGLSAALVAASTAYVVAGNERSPHGIARELKLAAADAITFILPPASAWQNEMRPTEYQIDVADSEVSSSSEIATTAIGGSSPVGSLPVAFNDETVMLSSASAAPVQPANPPAHRLDPAEIQLLVNQGQRLMAAGDFVSARIVLARAAQAGDSGAALAMGGTYDPTVLKNIGAIGIAGDPDEAHTWYEKARQVGPLEAAAQTGPACDALAMQAALCRLSHAPQRHISRPHTRRQRN